MGSRPSDTRQLFFNDMKIAPETMLGDTGGAVNPNDKRYKKFIGKHVILPIVNREIPIFSDKYVDMDFGTGCVKVTPAQDPNDYEMGKRHKLDIINIMHYHVLYRIIYID